MIIPVMPSTLRRIGDHAIRQYIKRVDNSVSYYRARAVVFYAYRNGHDATEYELAAMHRTNDDGEVIFRICDTCYGRIVMPIRRGVMTTLWLREYYQ